MDLPSSASLFLNSVVSLLAVFGSLRSAIKARRLKPPLNRISPVDRLKQLLDTGPIGGWLARLDGKETMNITKNAGMLLLAIYLILVGLIGVFGINLGQLHIVVPLLALIAGGLILIGK